jgi:hypothetical protein
MMVCRAARPNLDSSSLRSVTASARLSHDKVGVKLIEQGARCC